MMKKIMIVDDEKKIRGMYSRLLVSEGYMVREAQSADEANEILKSEGIDLVLLDIRMPLVYGSILYEMIMLFHKGTKVIVTSVYGLEEQRRIIKRAQAYFDKSEGTASLLTKIKEVMPDETGR